MDGISWMAFNLSISCYFSPEPAECLNLQHGAHLFGDWACALCHRICPHALVNSIN
jgi:hypothetical protein